MNKSKNKACDGREDIPLKSGNKSKWYFCDEDYLYGSKFIHFVFGIITTIITIALLIQIYCGDYQIVPHGSVATDSLECSNIGTLALKRGGNAVDAAISSAFCLAVATPHVTGLDAGGIILIYNHRSRLPPQIIDFSETRGPESLTKLVLGLLHVHKQYGVLPWRKLVEPAIDLARKGILVSRQLVQTISLAKAEKSFAVLEPGQLFIQKDLAQTLQKIAEIQETDVLSHIDDVVAPVSSEAIKLKFYDYNIFVPNNASMGKLLLKCLDAINKFNFTKNDILKHDYIYKTTDLIRRIYENENASVKYHEGTFSNIAVMDSQDNYVSFVTGLNTFFGSGGIPQGDISADKLDVAWSRFAILMTDAYNICGRRFVFGASNVVLASQIIMDLLIAKENVTEAIELPRFYVFADGTIGIEDAHLPAINNTVFTSKPLPIVEPYQSINIVAKIQDDLKSHSDSRGGGIANFINKMGTCIPSTMCISNHAYQLSCIRPYGNRKSMRFSQKRRVLFGLKTVVGHKTEEFLVINIKIRVLRLARMKSNPNGLSALRNTSGFRV